jgi:thiamine pyrophosphate-dependent acetolactate synthase large subunit-like protein
MNHPGPDYATLVAPFDGYGVRVEDPGQLKSALQNALAAVNGGKVAVVDIVLAA